MANMRFDGELFHCLRNNNVAAIFPAFHRLSITECEHFECMISAPIQELMPLTDDHRDRFERVKRLGHMMCWAVWNCRPRAPETEAVVQTAKKFSRKLLPDPAVTILHIRARLSMSDMPGLAHVVDFDVFSNLGRAPILHAQGSSLLKVYPAGGAILPDINPPSQQQQRPPTPPPPQQLPVEVPQQEPVEEPPRPASPPEPRAPPVEQKPAAQVAPDVQQRPSCLRQPGKVPIRGRVRFYDCVDTRAYSSHESFRFAYVSARDLNPRTATSLYLALAEIDVTPLDISFHPMPTKTTQSFIFNFMVDNRHDAHKIERMVVEEVNRFKLEALETSQPFFYWELSLNRLMKTILVSHRYYEASNTQRSLQSMVEMRQHLVAASEDLEVVTAIREGLSRNGKEELATIIGEIGQ